LIVNGNIDGASLGREAGKLGSLEAWRLGSWEVGKLESGEAEMLGSREAGKKGNAIFLRGVFSGWFFVFGLLTP